MLKEKTRTSQIQSDLADFCRTGKYQVEIPGVNNENLIHYHQLMYNVIEDSLLSTYPLVRKLLKKKEWDFLVADFVKNHNCSSPQIWSMPKEFQQFVLDQHASYVEKYPVLKDLMNFDWLELEMFMMDDQTLPYCEEGDLYKDALVVNPENKLVLFNYPVYAMKPKKINEQHLGAYFVVFYRNPSSGYVKHWEIPAAYIRLLELLTDKAQSVLSAAKKVCDEGKIPFDIAVENKALAFVEECLERRIILGYKPFIMVSG